MKRFYKFLMPLVMIMALALPWQMRAQDTLTVANGTETNSYIPIYGLWTDEAQHNQILYPASMLDDMSGSAVTQLTWYMSSPASSAWGTTVTIKMTEVSATSLSGHLPTTDATTVWTGVVNGTSSPITITFDVPYVYTGSNLLIDVTTTAATYSSCSWYGVSQSNASYYQYSSSTGSQSFLPKTTFVYSPASNICMPPTNVAATVTGSDADITWTEGDGSAWEIVWGVGAFNPDTVTINADYASSGSYSLTNLPDGPYNVYVRTDCGNNEYSVWSSLSFYINANGCMIGINGSDSYGDGWNGGSLAIVQGGNTVATFTLSTGSSASATYPVTGSMPVNFVWSSGSFDSEVSFSIIDGGGATVYSVSNPSTGTVYTMTDPCPTCFAPQGLEVVTLTPDSITFTWLPGGDETAWEVSNGIDTIEIYDTVYTFGGLTSNTIYIFLDRFVTFDKVGSQFDTLGTETNQGAVFYGSRLAVFHHLYTFKRIPASRLGIHPNLSSSPGRRENQAAVLAELVNALGPVGKRFDKRDAPVFGLGRYRYIFPFVYTRLGIAPYGIQFPRLVKRVIHGIALRHGPDIERFRIGGIGPALHAGICRIDIGRHFYLGVRITDFQRIAQSEIEVIEYVVVILVQYELHIDGFGKCRPQQDVLHRRGIQFKHGVVININDRAVWIPVFGHPGKRQGVERIARF